MLIVVFLAVAQCIVFCCVCVSHYCTDTQKLEQQNCAVQVKMCRRAFPLGNLPATPREEQMFAGSFVPMVAD